MDVVQPKMFVRRLACPGCSDTSPCDVAEIDIEELTQQHGAAAADEEVFNRPLQGFVCFAAGCLFFGKPVVLRFLLKSNFCFVIL